MLAEIGLKLINTKSWRWMPGMLTLRGDRVRSVTANGVVYLDRGYVSRNDNRDWIVAYALLECDDTPNTTDPATRGAAIEVLQLASGMMASLLWDAQNYTWSIRLERLDSDTFEWQGATIEEALLSAFYDIEAGLVGVKIDA